MVERFLAMLLGITVLPLRSFYHGLQYAIAVFFLGIALFIAIPFFAIKFLEKASFSLIVNILICLFLVFVLIPITTISILVFVAAAQTYLIYSTVSNMIQFTWSGLKNGYHDGMNGFWRVWSNQTSFFDGLFLSLGAFSNRFSTDAHFDDVGQFNKYELVEVFKKNSVNGEKLTNKDLEGFNKLLYDFAQLNIPVPIDIKNKIELLKVKMEQYTQLSVNLDLVEKALKNNKLKEIEDQLIIYNEVKTPVVLIKQYQRNDQNWYSVPANSYITDKDCLLTWLKESPKHPLNGDLLKMPSMYHNMPTRYRWHHLSTANCCTPELNEEIMEIRDLLCELSSQLDMLKQQKLNSGYSSRVLFKASVVNKIPVETDVADTEQRNQLVCFK